MTRWTITADIDGADLAAGWPTWEELFQGAGGNDYDGYQRPARG